MNRLELRGVQLEADFFDADFVGRYESATNALAAEADAANAAGYPSLSEGYRIQCEIVDRYFDSIFGEGTAAQVFKGCEKNIMDHLTAVETLTEWGNRQKKQLNDFSNKYTQRRNAQIQKGRAQQAGALKR